MPNTRLVAFSLEPQPNGTVHARFSREQVRTLAISLLSHPDIHGDVSWVPRLLGPGRYTHWCGVELTQEQSEALRRQLRMCGIQQVGR